MATLNWIGKEAVANHDKEVPFKLLEKVPSASVGKESKNLVIHGDNLEALKALLPFYQGEVKCIYIDPPYNTGNEDWAYNDNVSSPKIREWIKKTVGREGEDLTRHDKWLCMMYPRLKLLRDLLRDDGVIFVSIDDNEQHHLKILMDEIFTARNFIGQITVVGNPRGRDYGGIARMHDYLLVYSKEFGKADINNLNDPDKEFPFEDSRGGFEIRELRNRNIAFHIGNRPNLHYPFYVNPKKKDENGFFEISLEKKSGWTEVFPKESQGFKTVWRWGKARSQQNLNTEIVAKKMMDGGYQIVEKYRERTRMARSVWWDKDDNTEKGTLEVKNLFDGKKVFNFPKSMEMVRKVVEMGTGPDDIVLDSFAGSGTTGHAVLDLNKMDGGHRRFILVEMEDDVVKKITAERIKKAIKKYDYDGGFEYCELASALFDQNGLINESCSYADLASYIFFTETQTNVDKKAIKNPFVGESGGISYYLVYAGRGKNDLTRASLSKLKIAGPAVVYADRCLVDEDELKEKGITFKQIPYEITIY
ncbi:MAG TPA: site-specific DNA-methyltransferase [Candidatus Paceibacterota bacterium]|nr:site-specific DNA-methyltransferase [Candidatus Paceibacterota bacterium]